MPRQLDGKVAVVTGGCSGIGLGTVELFLAEGAKVVIGDLRDAKGQALETSYPGRVAYVHCDVTSEADSAKTVNTAQDAFGGLDILFNNAGAPGTLASL